MADVWWLPAQLLPIRTDPQPAIKTPQAHRIVVSPDALHFLKARQWSRMQAAEA